MGAKNVKTFEQLGKISTNANKAEVKNNSMQEQQKKSDKIRKTLQTT
jgi:hypothetical protein